MGAESCRQPARITPSPAAAKPAAAGHHPRRAAEPARGAGLPHGSSRPQCLSTIAVVQAETSSRRTTGLVVGYLFALACLAAWLACGSWQLDPANRRKSGHVAGKSSGLQCSGAPAFLTGATAEKPPASRPAAARPAPAAASPGPVQLTQTGLQAALVLACRPG